MTDNTLPATQAGAADIIERVVVEGDLGALSAQERVSYYRKVCESLGLNPFTKPFDYIKLNGKLTLYAKRDATDQLRKRDGVSVTIVSREKIDDLYAVTARATTSDGRSDESIGAVSIAGLKGENLANALMKAETKAKRRVTLSIVGLGWLDETEVATVPGAQVVTIDDETGEVTTGKPQGNGHKQTPQEQPQGWETWPENGRKRFWAKCNELGLSKETAHDEFDVTSMSEYKGTMEHAATVLKVLQYGYAQSLRLDQVCDALGVVVLNDFNGTEGEGIEHINAFIEQHQGVEELPL